MSENNKNRYEKEIKTGRWINNGNGLVWQSTVKKLVFDTVLRDWIQVDKKTETLSPEQLGYRKDWSFLIIFPDESAPQKKFGKAKKSAIKLLAKAGRVTVKPERKNTWLLKEYCTATGEQGSVGGNRLYIKSLEGGMLTYRFPYLTDENCLVELEDEEPITVAEVKDYEAKGVLIFFHAKAMWNGTNFEFADCAMNAQI